MNLITKQRTKLFSILSLQNVEFEKLLMRSFFLSVSQFVWMYLRPCSNRKNEPYHFGVNGIVTTKGKVLLGNQRKQSKKIKNQMLQFLVGVLQQQRNVSMIVVSSVLVSATVFVTHWKTGCGRPTRTTFFLYIQEQHSLHTNRNTHKCAHMPTKSCLTPPHLSKQPNTPTRLQATKSCRLSVSDRKHLYFMSYQHFNSKWCFKATSDGG